MSCLIYSSGTSYKLVAVSQKEKQLRHFKLHLLVISIIKVNASLLFGNIFNLFYLIEVGVEGIEPTRDRSRGIYSPARLLNGIHSHGVKAAYIAVASTSARFTN